MRWGAAACMVAAAAAHAIAAPERVVTGIVVDALTEEPVVGATVTTAHATTATSDTGDFSVVVTEDNPIITVTRAGYVLRRLRVTGQERMRIALAPSHELIEVSGTVPRPVVLVPAPPPFHVAPDAPAAPTTYQLTADELRSLPGTANDALRAAQVLPGTARLPFSFGGVVLRGAAPRDSVVLLDGIEVPLAFHFGGVTSFYPSGMLAELTVRNSGLDADIGRAAGGMISLTSREPRRDRWRTGGSVGLLDSSVFAEGPAHGGGMMIGLRRSYFDIVAGPIAAEDTPLPSYWDMQLRSSFGHPRKHGRVSPMLFFALDHMTQTEPGRNNFENETDVTSMFIRLAAPYDRAWGKTSLRVLPWFGTNQLRFRSRVNGIVERFERPVYPAGVRTQVERATGWGSWRAGLDMQGGYLTNYQAGLGHSGDILVQMNGETDIDWLDVGLWADTRFTLDRLTLRPGVRVEHYGLTGETVADPRLSLSIALTDELTLRQALGRYHQPPTPGDVDPNGGNPRLDSSYTDAVSLAVDAALPGGWSGSLAGFYSRGENLGVRLDSALMDFHDLGGLGPTFSLLLEKQLGLAFYRENIGKARNVGAELLVRRTTPTWSWLVAYTLTYARRHDGPGTGWRPFELDQRHNVNATAARNLGKWRVGARINIVSGMPFSPVVGSDADGDPIYDPYAGRLPAFFKLDVRVDRFWPQCWGVINLYFDIQNVTNRRNVEGREADELNRMDVDIRGLPIMPFVGLEFIPS